VELGQLLYYDRILSGNRNIACATCHHPVFGTSDQVSLSLGDGGVGLGPARKPVAGDNRPEQRIGRNSPGLFNLGAAEFQVLFHEGRLEADPSKKSGLRTPLDDDMVVGFDGVLSAQAMFPVLSGDEMAGHYSENDVARAVRQGMLSSSGGAWDIIAKRVSAIPEYVDRFRKIDRTIEEPDDIDFTDISNAMAAFIAFEFRADDSPFDRYLRGDGELSEDAVSGMALFYGKAGCSRCHSGVFQTDHDFHAIAMPQLGPGKVARFETHQRDVGRMRVTGRSEDKYKFRTPSLRNVELTAPFGHSGAFATLEAVVRHHLDPVESLKAYDRRQAILADFPEADDWFVLDDADEVADIAAANEMTPMVLDDAEVDALIVFLKALTDPISQTGRLGVPSTVPSGLPVDHVGLQ
jgi:cytochrome c peroxidase